MAFWGAALFRCETSACFPQGQSTTVTCQMLARLMFAAEMHTQMYFSIKKRLCGLHLKSTSETQNHRSPGFEPYATFSSSDFEKTLLKLLSLWLGKWWVAVASIHRSITLRTLSRWWDLHVESAFPHLLVGSRRVKRICDSCLFISHWSVYRVGQEHLSRQKSCSKNK